MIDSFYIAWRYVTFNRVRTLILITCITLIAALPLVAVWSYHFDGVFIGATAARAMFATMSMIVGPEGRTRCSIRR